MPLPLQFPKDVIVKSTTDLKQYFNTPANNLYYTNDLLFSPPEKILVTYNEASDGAEVYIDEFQRKFQLDEVRFDLDPNRTRATIARCLGAGIISQTHAAELHSHLTDTTPLSTDDFLSDLANAAQGAVFIAPMVLVMYFVMQYFYVYYKTGQTPQWDSPELRQILWESLILGIQTCIIAFSIVLAQTLIPLLLQALNFQITGPLIHLPLAPVFGLIYASSLFFYDRSVCKEAYGQSPWKRFGKNFILGMGLYLGQLIPGLTTVAEAICAFAVPISINLLWGWGAKQLPRPEPGDQHDTMNEQAGHLPHYQNPSHSRQL
ncbi:MAG: hypothetical protein WC748_06565 [Legionellales bacterium]|jgi:hypothetical protein